MTPPQGNNWERWRGMVDTRLQHVEDECEGTHHWLKRLDIRVQKVEVKIAVYAALGAMAGSSIAFFGHWLLDRLAGR